MRVYGKPASTKKAGQMNDIGPALFFPTKRRLDRFLQLLRGAESDFLRRLDLDRLARRGIAAHARGALAHDEDAKTIETDARALLQMFGDQSDRVFKDRVRGLVRHVMLFGQRGAKLAGAHRIDLWFGGLRGGRSSYCHSRCSFCESNNA